jgi:hypothetical protein
MIVYSVGVFIAVRDGVLQPQSQPVAISKKMKKKARLMAPDDRSDGRDHS